MDSSETRAPVRNQVTPSAPTRPPSGPVTPTPGGAPEAWSTLIGLWGRVLPPDVIRDAPRRLRVASGAFLLLAGFSFLFQGPLVWFLAPWALQPNILICLGLQFLVSLVVHLTSRRAGADPARIIEIGLWYEVFLAFSIAMQEYMPPIHADTQYRGASWVTVVMVLFPVLVPTPPRRTLKVALLAASMGPLAVLFYGCVGLQPGFTFSWLIGPCIDFYASALLVLAPSVVISRLGSDLAAARTLGSYTLEKKLGEGGMGQVWRARHLLLRRPAAIKVIAPEALGHVEADVRDGSAARRFEREAQATAALSCPHTVTLFDYGIADDGTFYYVMELLDGLDLGTLVDRFGPVSPSRCVHFLRQICLSLDEAHMSGMVHRDIKPANIYACRLGRQVDFIKVLDFGLVKVESAEPGARLTVAGTISGTPDFMSPEQARGEKVDDRTDIYALGCVAYHLLTGRPPFQGRGFVEVLAAHQQQDPVPPSRYAPEVPADLEAVILACLEKDARHRPQGAIHLEHMLAGCACAGGWSEARAREWWRDNMPASGDAEPEGGH